MIKKINKKVMMIILLILLISLSLGIGAYAAYVLNATEVQYTKSDGTTVNVKDALDELYIKNPYQNSSIIFDIGDKVKVGNEYFYVVEYSPQSTSNVKVICQECLMYDSSNSKYRQVQNASETAWTQPFASTAYWKDYITSGRDNIDINVIPGYNSTDVMGIVKQYGVSVRCDLEWIT